MHLLRRWIRLGDDGGRKEDAVKVGEHDWNTKIPSPITEAKLSLMILGYPCWIKLSKLTIWISIFTHDLCRDLGGSQTDFCNLKPTMSGIECLFLLSLACRFSDLPYPTNCQAFDILLSPSVSWLSSQPCLLRSHLRGGATKKGLKAERDSECDSRRCTSHFNFFQNLLKKLKMRWKSTVIGFYLHCSLDVSCASFVTVPIVPKITFHPFLSLVLSPDCITLRLDLWIMSGLALWPDRPRDRGDVFTHRHSCQ